MTAKAKGTFEVKLVPQAPDGYFGDASLARMTIDKQFSGQLKGSSRGQMLSAITEVKGSAGYVAIERVSATLDSREGTFILQHSATMERGKPQQSISVVPDSGTGELKGLTGNMTIDVSDGKHYYEFDYLIEDG